MSSAERKYVLAIDIGTGSVKAAVVSSRAEVVASDLRHIETRMLPGGGAEQDPNEWWSAVIDAAKSAIARAAVPPERIIAAACTGQWAVTVPVNEYGDALMNALSWMDRRGAPYNCAIVDGWPRIRGYGLLKLRKWIKLTAAAPVRSGMDGLGHVLYIKHERPDIYARTRAFLEPTDYLNFRLTGRVAASYGTIFPYWLTDNRDPNKIDYVPELLRLAGVDRAKMPDLMPVNAVLGNVKREVAAELGLSTATKVMMGSCDGHAAAIGAGAVRDYQGYFYIGTTSWLSCHVPKKKTDLIHMISTMLAALPGRYVVTAEQGMAGRCLDFLKDILSPLDDTNASPGAEIYEYFNRVAAQVAPGSDGLIFTPWLSGVLAPADDPFTRSAFINQTARTTRAHYVRSVMEGVAFNMRWLKENVERFIGHRFDALNFIGGAAQSGTWCQILADILNCPIRQVANPRHANAVGAAMAAFATLGEIRVDDISSLVKIAATSDPDVANRRVYAERFDEFMDFYKRMRATYKRVNAVDETSD
jgi:xylulokinase